MQVSEEQYARKKEFIMIIELELKIPSLEITVCDGIFNPLLTISKGSYILVYFYTL